MCNVNFTMGLLYYGFFTLHRCLRWKSRNSFENRQSTAAKFQPIKLSWKKLAWNQKIKRSNCSMKGKYWWPFMFILSWEWKFKEIQLFAWTDHKFSPVWTLETGLILNCRCSQEVRGKEIKVIYLFFKFFFFTEASQQRMMSAGEVQTSFVTIKLSYC